jgi:hypothetical protein
MSAPVARVVLILCAVILVTSWSVSWTSLALGLLLTAPIMVVALPPVIYNCQRGTLVITYPPGGQIFVNGLRLPTCSSAGGGTTVNLQPFAGTPLTGLNTFWFASPSVLDLDMNGTAPETIICSSGCRVYDNTLKLIQTLSASSRVYAPQCTVDLDGNKQADLCFAAGSSIYCYEWSSATRQFAARAGFPLNLNGYIGSSEIRGMACGDINFDGKVEIAVSTTHSGIQTFVVSSSGGIVAGWPRYNTDSGPDGDADPGNKNYNGRNGNGHYRYGSYGLNVGIGQMDDDPYLEVLSSFDNHQFQAFKRNGLAINMGSFYKQVNNANKQKGSNITWGQKTPTWTNKSTDDYQWNQLASGSCYANPVQGPGWCVAGGDEWLQFTESPMHVMDLDADGKVEVISLPNTEKGDVGGGYITLRRVAFVIDGAYGNGGDPHVAAGTSGYRHAITGGVWDAQFPPSGGAFNCPQCFDSTASCGTCRVNKYYPPGGVPAIAFGDLKSTGKQNMVASFNDGWIRVLDEKGAPVWSQQFSTAVGIDPQVDALEASEPVIADLSGDGLPEVIFAVYGKPNNPAAMSAVNNQRLFVLNGQDGSIVQNIQLNTLALKGDGVGNGNGNGPAGAPTIADIDGDGTLEVSLHTFDGRFIVFTAVGSQANCMLWPTARGGYMRKGQPDYSYTH